MGGGHIIYIPMILFAGMILGFLVGRNHSSGESDAVQRRLDARAARVARLKDEIGAAPKEDDA